jgi:hypothetical protein
MTDDKTSQKYWFYSHISTGFIECAGMFVSAVN